MVGECVSQHSIVGEVHGDLEGAAQLMFDGDEFSASAHAMWTIEMMQRPMRLAARFAHPLLRWGHDRVVEGTVDGFQHRALQAEALAPTRVRESERKGDDRPRHRCERVFEWREQRAFIQREDGAVVRGCCAGHNCDPSPQYARRCAQRSLRERQPESCGRGEYRGDA